MEFIIAYIIGIIIAYYGIKIFYESWNGKYQIKLFDIIMIFIPFINCLFGIMLFLLRNKENNKI